MVWEPATAAEIDRQAYYLVKTNAFEWGDREWEVMRGSMVNFKLAPHYVRGRPLYVSRITDPDSL